MERKQEKAKGSQRPEAHAAIVTPLAPPDDASLDDGGLSLEELGQAFAAALAGGQAPYAAEQAAERERAAAKDEDDRVAIFEERLAPPEVDRHCELSPASVLEAILFVGRPDNEPITSAEVARLMRGVRPIEIDELVIELNEAYDREQAPYRIASAGAGYRMELRPEYDRLCRRVYGKLKEVRLSQAAIDCLAIVAYKQPVRREDVDKLRGKASGGPLSLLVRRGLLRLDRGEVSASAEGEGAKRPVYRTTQRFLEVFRLERLDDLPQAQQVEAEL